MYTRLLCLGLLTTLLGFGDSRPTTEANASPYGHTLSGRPHPAVVKRAIIKPTFGYNYYDGPLQWGDLSPNNTMCKQGDHQSPININTTATTPSSEQSDAAKKDRSIHYDTFRTAEFQNLGTTLEVTPDEAVGGIEVAGKKYTLTQFHFHTPSEHRIDDEHFPMEMHLVHVAEGMWILRVARVRPTQRKTEVEKKKKNKRRRKLKLTRNLVLDKSILVFGIVLEINTLRAWDAPFIRDLGYLVPHMSHFGDSLDLSSLRISLDPVMKIFKHGNVFEYTGSLTTPPCSENVSWIVSKTPLHISEGT